MAKLGLLSNTNRVETPFILIDIGGYVFGKYSKNIQNIVSPIDGFTRQVKEFFPNYVQSIDIVKINGMVNTYTISLVYAIRAGEDPDKINKILSTVSKTRRIKISYGDYSAPNYIYKDEEAIITNVSQQLQMRSSQILYTLTATSAVKLATQGNYTFDGGTFKPSDKIYELLNDKRYGLLEVFYGMQNIKKIKQLGLIASDDKAVYIPARTNISVFDYITYLVNSMQCVSDGNGIDGRHRYGIQCIDDTTGELGGPYFKISKLAINIQETTSLDMYEINVGFPDVDPVISFNITDNTGYSILYDYQASIEENNYEYRINDAGEFDIIEAPSLLKNKELFTPTQAELTWWAQVTQYPVKAQIQLRGLLRPALLMTYVKLTIMFYGRKSSLSGTYIITQQEDNVSESGYRTTLTLLRIKGEFEQ